MNARARPLTLDDFSALVKQGSATCAPGKPCGMLASAIDETRRTAPVKGCPGLERYFTGKGEEGVAYRVAPGAPLLVLNVCPWCAESPWKAGDR